MLVKRIPKPQNVLVLGTDDYHAVIGLWCLRLLINAKGWKYLVPREGFIDDDIVEVIGLDAYVDEPIKPAAARRLLKKQLRLYESKASEPRGLLYDNIERLSVELSLSGIEKQVLLLLCLMEQSPPLDQMFELFPKYYERGLRVSLIAVAMDAPRAAVDEAISRHSNLCRCGLLREHSGYPHRDDDLRPLSGLSSMLFYEPVDGDSFLTRFCNEGRQAKLRPQDFEHVQVQYQRLGKYLKAAVKKETQGVNVLLYGDPGSGKTELVRVLMAELGLDLFDVGSATGTGDSLRSGERLDGYRVCQSLLSRTRSAVVLFDEIEDVFTGYRFSGSKAWLNEMLETNPRPAFWLSNDISVMDPAFVRRFDLVFEMPALTTRARRKIAQEHLQGLPVSKGWLDKVAERKEIQPAHLASAAKVIRHLGYRNGSRVEGEIDAIMSDLYQALGVDISDDGPRHAVQAFDPQLSNTDLPLTHLVKGLQRSRMGRICLYGPPGTGKSEMARHLADVLKQPLLVHSGASLLDPYVGGSEKLITSAFEEAQDCKAVLLIDEADSLLFSREGASQSWEVSQVNELLVRMERFEGIFIASTNYMGRLDAASLRRFDLKIRFDYLKPEQAWQLFRNCFPKRGMALPQHQGSLQRLSQLTPGDFATVTRRHRVLANPLTPQLLLAGLAEEMAGRAARTGRPIGFMV